MTKIGFHAPHERIPPHVLQDAFGAEAFPDLGVTGP